MAQIAGQTQTSSALNFLGTLRLFKKRSNTLLKIIGAVAESNGLSASDTLTMGGFQTVNNYEYPTNLDYDIPAPSQPAILEGAVAPAVTTATFTQGTNVVQLFQEAVDISYLKMSTNGRYSGPTALGQTPEQAAKARQIQIKLEKVAQDANFSFVNGVYVNPGNPAATALRTRGLRTAIITNVVANGSPAALTQAMLGNLYRSMIDNSGMQPEQLIMLANTAQLAAISALYQTQFNQGQDKMVGGVMVRTVYTAFGVLNIALEMDMPQTEVLFLNPDVIAGVQLPVPGKGEGVFYEMLGTVGSSEKGQLYGQLGFQHGPEWCHGKITNLT